ncbi:hypothetical protein LZ518_04540 [Sphingomonas sp. RB56-2]|uniref:Glucosamine inositolphosphorylceramide transferase 1 N-terminal domain-containing protein n=1 Tax=Sphingomonas brevis TaxID=2908206 RepID=A0ABT0S7U2_9SPHN|nr:hypothetical protein [Sphingomonas brevis]MCL6740397.1 hypothetical protein [Sphingomonas brevis]
MKIGLIVDDLGLARWQADALACLPADCEFLVYNCTNSGPSRRSLGHAFYYALNMLSLRTGMSARVALPDELKILAKTDFKAEFEGSWQCLPEPLLRRIAADRPSVLIKFGMGLLLVPPKSDLPVPILSYHHGDPRAFRGRPAGFYELLTGSDVIGQVVQILSNNLDAGEIVAYGETKCHGHSYRRTMLEAYRCSPLLLRAAVDNAVNEVRVPITPSGKVYRLPSNGLVVRFAANRLINLARHWAYGAMVEKVWQVAEAAAPRDGEAGSLLRFPDRASWHVIQCPRQYRFLADPFFYPNEKGLLVEGLNKATNLGEILHVDETAEILSSGKAGRHFSYPATINENGQDYMVPEISEWSSANIYRLSRSGSEDLGELDVPGRPRLIDPTIFSNNHGIFLFANDDGEGDSVLRLWHASSLFARFAEHPASPIRISPAGSRMAGAIHVAADGNCYRFGQDLRRDYGDGLIMFRIDTLTPSAYQEARIGSVRLSGVRGPHTLNVRDGRMIFDFYSNRFTPWAGVRRLKARAARRAN